MILLLCKVAYLKTKKQGIGKHLEKRDELKT
jgi:hypothetical protein